MFLEKSLESKNENALDLFNPYLCPACLRFGYCRVEFFLWHEEPATTEEELVALIPIKNHGAPSLREAIKAFHQEDYVNALNQIEIYKPSTNNHIIWLLSGISNKRLHQYDQAYNDLENFVRYAELTPSQERGVIDLMNICKNLVELNLSLPKIITCSKGFT